MTPEANVKHSEHAQSHVYPIECPNCKKRTSLFRNTCVKKKKACIWAISDIPEDDLQRARWALLLEAQSFDDIIDALLESPGISRDRVIKDQPGRTRRGGPPSDAHTRYQDSELESRSLHNESNDEDSGHNEGMKTPSYSHLPVFKHKG
jgi:hypothetical protein